MCRASFSIVSDIEVQLHGHDINCWKQYSPDGELAIAACVVVGDRHIFRYFNDKPDPLFETTQALTYHRIFLASPRRAVFRGHRPNVSRSLYT